MGWLENRKEKKEESSFLKDLQSWQTQINNVTNCIKIAKDFNGEQTDAIMLSLGETLYFYVTNTALIEERRGPGQWQGGSSGVSIPVGHIGHSAVRYHVGASKGTYVQGQPHDTVIDNGTTFITNKRVIFEGGKQTRECRFDKLVGVTHNDTQGTTTIAISNRQKPVSIAYGASLSPAFDFRLSLALAHYKNSVADLISQLEDTLAKLQSVKPVDPVTNPN